PLNCAGDNDCPFFKLAKCGSGHCAACAASGNCDHLEPHASCVTVGVGGKECQVSCSSSDMDSCLNMRAYCYSGKCKLCSSSSNCANYPQKAGLPAAECQDVSGLGKLCIYCDGNNDCPFGYTCNNYKCVECFSNADCTTAAKPSCIIKFEGNYCGCVSN